MQKFNIKLAKDTDIEYINVRLGTPYSDIEIECSINNDKTITDNEGILYIYDSLVSNEYDLNSYIDKIQNCYGVVIESYDWED